MSLSTFIVNQYITDTYSSDIFSLKLFCFIYAGTRPRTAEYLLTLCTCINILYIHVECTLRDARDSEGITSYVTLHNRKIKKKDTRLSRTEIGICTSPIVAKSTSRSWSAVIISESRCAYSNPAFGADKRQTRRTKEKTCGYLDWFLFDIWRLNLKEACMSIKIWRWSIMHSWNCR